MKNSKLENTKKVTYSVFGGNFYVCSVKFAILLPVSN